MAVSYSVGNILSVARIHPFYTSLVKYPPSSDDIGEALKREDGQDGPQLSAQPLLHKDKLYKTIERLYADENPANPYRENSYISITGSGFGKSLPMVFLTDAEENASQRLAMSQLMKACKLIERSDWVLNIHPGDLLYRALDLSTQDIEQAGGSVLCAGYNMPHEKSLAACIKFRVNVITGDCAHILNFVHFVASFPSSARRSLKIAKVIYTCEMMTFSKRKYLISILGPVSIFSMFASAETGPWAVAILNTGTAGNPDGDDAVDFLYDTRTMSVEVLSRDSGIWTSESSVPPREEDFVEEDAAGHLVLTSLQRLKNPLVRYVSGDVGSLHSLPESSYPQIDTEMRKHLKVLRLYGRDKRFSFKWLGEYYEFDKVERVMQTEEWGILEWQIIIEHGKRWEGSDSIELRVMQRSEDDKTLSRGELVRRFHDVFFLTELTEKLFHAVFLDNLQGFERSETSTKIVRFIDRRTNSRL